jgi:hypothetical protein
MMQNVLFWANDVAFTQWLANVIAAVVTYF